MGRQAGKGELSTLEEKGGKAGLNFPSKARKLPPRHLSAHRNGTKALEVGVELNTRRPNSLPRLLGITSLESGD